jgi:DNA-binding transcriptional ArsR family regulator
MTVEYVIRGGRRIEVGTIERHAAPKRRRAEQHIGCPVEWLKRIRPLVNTRDQLLVAIWLHRRRAICRNELFTVPNKALQEDLGLSRRVKYRALSRLERAGVIALIRDGKHTPKVRFLW